MRELRGKARACLNFQEEFWQIDQWLTSCHAMTQDLEALRLLNLLQTREDERVDFQPSFVFDLLDTNTRLGESRSRGAIGRIESACKFIQFQFWFSLSS